MIEFVEMIDFLVDPSEFSIVTVGFLDDLDRHFLMSRLPHAGDHASELTFADLLVTDRVEFVQISFSIVFVVGWQPIDAALLAQRHAKFHDFLRRRKGHGRFR